MLCYNLILLWSIEVWLMAVCGRDMAAVDNREDKDRGVEELEKG